MSEATDTLYPWKRFWCPWEKSISLADDGFVYDPESDYGAILNPDLVTLDSTIDLRCLILLGEPGLGKSHALREHYAALESTKDSYRRVMLVDLKDFGSDPSLTRGVFDSAEFQEWKRGDSRLYLLVDSFDEGLLTIESLSGYLSRELRSLAVLQPSPAMSGDSSKSVDSKIVQDGTDTVSTVAGAKRRPLDRLYLRVACRPATWPTSLTEHLRTIFSEGTVSILRLAPLRRCDVELAAHNEGAPNFVSETISRSVVPFATKPLTLKALLNLYKSKEALPNSRRRIYEELCRVACTEPSKSRQERQKTGHLTREGRVSVASRVAALMVFCNRTRLRTDPLEDLGNDELGIDAIFGHERPKGYDIVIDHRALAETLDTALFTWPKSHHVAWDHRTYCEFLAAEYCHVHRISARAVLRLIFTEAFGEKRVAPQLHETTAWLCSLYPSLRAEVLACDPVVLLLSDVLKNDVSIRYKITEQYLESFQKEQIFNDQIRDELRLLEHPHLAGQLRRYISEKSKKARARSRAMDIAAACQVRDVEHEVIKVALDSRESIPIRSHALFTLGQYPDSSSRALLRELVTRPVAQDREQEIKGWALMAMWPGHISTSELFDALTDPGPPNFVGGYATFLSTLSRDLGSTLQDGDLESALDWVEKLGINRHVANRMTAVADSILLRTWDSLRNPTILDRFARIVLKCIENHVPVAQSDDLYRPGLKRRFDELLTQDTVKRRILIARLIRELATQPATFQPFRLIYCEDRIVRVTDTAWLIEQLPVSTPAERKVIESLLERMPDDSESLNAFRSALDERRLPSAYETKVYIDLSSELALRLKKQYEELEPRPRHRKLLVPSPKERISELLKRIRTGHPEDWSALTRTLTLKEYSEYYGDEEDDLRKLPGWLTADDSTRAEIVSAAQRFLLEYKPTPEEYSQQTFGHWIIAAYLAFALLHDEDMSFLDGRDEAFWNCWAGFLISYRFDHTRGVDRKLLRLVAERWPGAISIGLDQVLIPALEDCNFLNKLSDTRFPKVEARLMQSLRDAAFKPRCSEVILSLLLEHGSAEAQNFAISLTKQVDDSESQIRGAVGLLKYAPGKSQDIVWPLIKGSESLGRRILESVSDIHGGAKFLDSWSEATIGELFVWIAKRYPYSETIDQRSGAFLVGTTQALEFFRDALLNHLRDRGTVDAVEALRRAGKELNAPWMKWHVVEAKNAGLRREWKPAEPSELLTLAAEAESLTQGQVGYRVAALLSLLLNLLAGLLTPTQLSGRDRAFVATGTAFLALALMEKGNRRRSFWFPLWVILLLTDVAGWLVLRLLPLA